MAKFGIDKGQLEISPNLHVRQGIVDESAGKMASLAGDVIKEGVTKYQTQSLANELSDISADEATLQAEAMAEMDAAMSNPAVKGLEGRLAQLKKASGTLGSGAFEARAKAELKRRINQTPGLTKELNATFAQFMDLDEFALAEKARRSKTTKNPAQDLLDRIDKDGTNNYNLIPGWTSDPDAVRSYERRKHMQMKVDEYESSNALRNAMMKQQESENANYISNANVELKNHEINKLRAGKRMDYTVANLALDLTESGLPITGPDGNPLVINGKPLMSNDYSSLSNLPPDAKAYMLQTWIPQIKNRMYTQLTASGKAENIDQSVIDGHMKTVDFFVEGMTAALDDSKAGDAMKNAFDLRYNTFEFGLSQNPQTLGFMSMGKHQLVPKDGVDAKLFQMDNMDMLMENPRKLAGNNWRAGLQDLTRFYSSPMKPDTPRDVAEAGAAPVSAILKDAKERSAKMSLEESSSVLALVATEGVESLAKIYPKLAEEGGPELGRILPNVMKRFMFEYNNDLANNFQGTFLKYEDGKFASAAVGDISGEDMRNFDTKYVDMLNNAVGAYKALGFKEDVAKNAVLQNMPKERMFGLIHGELSKQMSRKTTSNVLPTVPDSEVRSIFDGLYGEGEFDKFKETSRHTGMKRVGTANGKPVYEDENGNQFVDIGA